MRIITTTLLTYLLLCQFAIAQTLTKANSDAIYKIETIDRNVYHAKILAFEKTQLRIESMAGEIIVIQRDNVLTFKEVKATKKEPFSFNGSDLSHYFITSPAINLRAKESVFSYQLPLYMSYSYGISNSVSIEVGTSTIAFLVGQPAFFLASKINIINKKNFRLGTSISYVSVLSDGQIPSASLILPEVKCTLGNVYKNLTLSIGIPKGIDAASFRSPLFSGASQIFIGPRTSLVFEFQYVDVIRLFDNEQVDAITNFLPGVRVRRNNHSFDFGLGLLRSRFTNSSNEMITALYPYLNYNLDLKRKRQV